ncbi:hypothetical protein IFM89_018155 [Coptis chinensis]|uniref:Pentatricopeptide repeat-containing protein n=1 Tax=Coptis chinensis TaxID=261450 RepID=A0A835HUW8_9MAGN|nr:hypothetical protein IFM89_018155 [Coptis chinensis]
MSEVAALHSGGIDREKQKFSLKNDVVEARKVLITMVYRNVVSWTSMIAVLAAGKVTHGAVFRRGYDGSNVIASRLVDMYAKCGFITYSNKLNSMYTKHGIVPDAKHYICTVDMLGRTGRLDEAHQLAKTIRTEAKEAELLWGSLLSASRTHGRLDIIVEAGQRLIDSNQQVAGAYVTMSNTFAKIGKWDNAYKIRFEMKRHGIRKELGCSWVEIKDATYIFYAGDLSSCTQEAEITTVLKELEPRMKERGYVSASKGLVFVDVEEEVKRLLLVSTNENWC